MDMESLYDKIYRYCYYRVRDEETARDLTQETFLRFLGSNYEERGEKIRYLYTIARNLCIEEARKAKFSELPEDLSDQGMESEELVDRIRVNMALKRMPEADRELLILRYMNGESVTEICRITGISRFALYRRLKAAEKIFTELMDKESR